MIFKKNTQKILFWAPRVLGIIFAAFISIFALDVFGEYDFPEVAVALFMHMIPSFLIIIVLMIAWRWEHIGGIIFIILGILYMILTGSRGNLSMSWILSGPLFLIAILFFVSKLVHKK